MAAKRSSNRAGSLWLGGLTALACLTGTASAQAPTALEKFRDLPLRDRGTLFQWLGNAVEGGGPPGMDQRLASDRPDFTEASTTVGAGVRQLEMGYTYIGDRQDGFGLASHSGPEALLRVGVWAEWLELRVAFNTASTQAVVDGSRRNFSGAEDLYVGAKLGLTPQAGWLPEVALMPQATLDTGSADLTAGRNLPGLNLLYGWDLNDDWSLGGSTQFNRAVDADGSLYTEWAQSVTVGRTLSDQLGGYFEYFVLAPYHATAVVPEHYLDGGFTFSVTNDLQFDVRGGVGLNPSAADYFLGTGMVVRF